MIYYRCKCGKRESWSSLGRTLCETCPDCGSTFGESPNDHPEPEPHRWSEPKWEIDEKTGERWQERTCTACMKRERVES